MHRHTLVILATALALGACSKVHPPAHVRGASVPAEAVPLGRLPETVVPNRYRIALTVDPRRDAFSGHCEIDVAFAEKRRAIFIHGRNLNVLAASVRLSARHVVPAHYMQVDRSGVARLLFVDEIPAGKATLVFDYEAPLGQSLYGLYKVVEHGEAYAFTQFEPSSAREVFPSFDEPGFKTPFQVKVVAPPADRVVGNAPIQSVTRAAGMNSTLFQWTKPLPTYLLAVAIGPFDIVDAGDIPPNQYRSRPIHLRGIAVRGNGPRMRYALSLTPRIVGALEDYFGVAYPFPKLDLLAVPDFAAGAMENAGAITFRERLVLLDPNASIDQKRSALAVQSHEITHQWMGDLVTPAWWDDTWLNESFATWMEYKIAQTVLPDEQFDTETLRDGLQVMERDELASSRQIHQPVRNADDIADSFDAITYDKGAAVLSMFEGFVGADLFRKGLHAYLSRFALRNATARDFIETIAATAARQPHPQPETVAITIDENGRIAWNGHSVAGMSSLMDQLSHMSSAVSAPQIAESFSSFIDQPGVPDLHVSLSCTGAASAQVSQSVYAPIGTRPFSRAWKVPFCLGVAGQENYCRLLDRKSTEVMLGSSCPPALLPNAAGRGYFRFTLDSVNRADLIGKIAAMKPADQIVLLYGLAAGLRDGSASAQDLLAAIANVAIGARWDVLDSIQDILHSLRLHSEFSAADFANYRQFIANHFESRFAKMRSSATPGEPTDTALARSRLAALMVSEAHDHSAIADLAAQATALVDGNENALPPELAGEAFRAGLLAHGRAFANRLLNLFQTSNNEYLRRQIVYGFAGSDDAGVIRSLLALALTPKMRAGEIRYFYQYMSEEPVASGVLWNWLETNFSALQARAPRAGLSRIPSVLQRSCDLQSQSELAAFFAAHGSSLTGITRPLAQSEEEIARCVVFRQAKYTEIETALREAAH